MLPDSTICDRNQMNISGLLTKEVHQRLAKLPLEIEFS